MTSTVPRTYTTTQTSTKFVVAGDTPPSPVAFLNEGALIENAYSLAIALDPDGLSHADGLHVSDDGTTLTLTNVWVRVWNIASNDYVPGGDTPPLTHSRVSGTYTGQPGDELTLT